MRSVGIVDIVTFVIKFTLIKAISYTGLPDNIITQEIGSNLSDFIATIVGIELQMALR